MKTASESDSGGSADEAQLPVPSRLELGSGDSAGGGSRYRDRSPAVDGYGGGVAGGGEGMHAPGLHPILCQADFVPFQLTGDACAQFLSPDHVALFEAALGFRAEVEATGVLG